MKPKVSIFVLCYTERGGWVNPYLCQALLCLQQDPRITVKIEMRLDCPRVEHARNLCIVDARTAGADICIQFDNDNAPPLNFADIVLKAFNSGKAVVSLPYGILPNEAPQILPQDAGIMDGQFRQTELAGGGVLIISSEVWRVIPRGPWFRWPVNDDEVLSMREGEDYAFCTLVRSHGLAVWTHECAAAHFKTTEVTKLIARLTYAESRAI